MVPNKTIHEIPSKGFRGISNHWQNDLIAAFSVSLVALPLGLGVAMASGVPPMSGVISAIIGGLVTTLFRGSHIAINGPAAGLIAVMLAGLSSLNDGSGNTLNYLLAAIFISGLLQIVLGLLKLGKYAEVIPTSVIHGILAAIGIIIFSKQVHIALGTDSDAPTIIGVLLDIPQSILNANPIITFLSLLSVILLVFHAKISYKLFHFVPAPVWVLVIAILFVYGFNFLQPHDVTLFGKAFPVGPSFLIDLPENILQAVIHPDFSRLGDLPFWLTVASITIIASIQNLAMAKAVDKLDPYKRKTNLDKDLIGVGIGTAICGLIGGLPIITVIVRSSVNIHNNAKTSWSNFYHGIFLLLFIILLSPIIQKIPLAALAAILVFTGYKLASPRVIKQTYSQGIEQLLFFSVTLAITLATNLLWGILSGMAITLAVHLLLARMPVELFLKKIFKSNTRLIKQKDLSYELQVDGIANFLSMPKLKDLLNAVPEGANLRIDLSETHLVDLTVLEFFQEYGGKLKSNGGKFDLKGLQHHVASTNHPLALKSLNVPLKSKKSPRQISLEAFSKETGGDYMLEVDLDTSYLRNFQFFESRPIERKTNVIKGNFSNPTIQWEMADITFDEGALQASEVYHTTVQVIHLPFEIPRFILEKEGFFDKIFDRVLALSGQKDIDFQLFTKFSNRFLLKGEDEAIIRAFFTEELILFFENTDVYHVESNGEALLIFQYLRLARTEEASKMLMFSEDLIHLLATQIER